MTDFAEAHSSHSRSRENPEQSHNLPRSCLSHMVTRGALRIVQTRPALPPVSYVALHRADQSHSLNADIARLAAQCCDFSSNLLDPGR